MPASSDHGDLQSAMMGQDQHKPCTLHCSTVVPSASLIAVHLGATGVRHAPSCRCKHSMLSTSWDGMPAGAHAGAALREEISAKGLPLDHAPPTYVLPGDRHDAQLLGRSSVAANC